MKRALIYDAIRTARGKARPTGGLHKTKPIELVAGLMHALAERNSCDPTEVQDVVLGCVTQTGEQGANIAKIAALYAGWGDRVPGVTVNRFCTSGLDAVVTAAMQIQTNTSPRVVAGGVESMSRVPMFSDAGAWFADEQVAEATRYIHMGLAADLLATRSGIGRDELDEWTARSHARAAAAQEADAFGPSVVPVGGLVHDELVRPHTTRESLAALPPAFAQVPRPHWLTEHIDNRHTVASSPGMCDGASLLLMGEEHAFGDQPARAEVVAWATVSVDPVVMLTGNVDASTLALERAGLAVSDVEVWEVNESFAAVPIHFIGTMGVDPARVNPSGGALALGHPLGATGGVLMATALDELDRRGGGYGVVTICGGAGVATAVVLRRLARG